jgi:hypothetical protein
LCNAFSVTESFWGITQGRPLDELGASPGLRNVTALRYRKA